MSRHSRRQRRQQRGQAPPGGASPEPTHDDSAPDATDLTTHLEDVEVGATPGIEHDELDRLPSTDAPIRITCIDYALDRAESRRITDLPAFIATHRPEWSAVRWINVDGLTNMKVIQALARKYQLHPLAIEDMLHLGQRPKLDFFGGHSGELQARIFIVARMLRLDPAPGNDAQLCSEQVSMFLGHKTVLTFQESRPGDVWDPIRQRIERPGTRLRQNDAGFLVYALLDAIVDHCFPLLEHYSDRLDKLEDSVLDRPSGDTIHEIHDLKRELLDVRRAVWPMREVINIMHREPHECMSDTARTYMRDVYDHAVQIIDIIETYREVATSLTETYMSAMSNKLNETMRLLTIIGTIFIPLTFLAGVYGMNFRRMPELETNLAYPWVYPIGFWGVCVLTAVGMYVWFKRRRWL
ncbi:MAG: magnesium/cobalt transporter CorA [Phycisphaeraceae bacterium]